MSVGKRFFRVGAAAAVVVAGVWVGTGGAAEIEGGKPYVSASAAVISVSFPLEGEIQWIGNNAFSEDDLKVNPDQYIQIKPGNLGMVRIKTNAERWDVSFVTDNGGKLYAAGKETNRKELKDPTCKSTLLKPVCDSVYVKEPGEYLRYKDKKKTVDELASDRFRTGGGTSDSDFVVLGMSIGAAGNMTDANGSPGGYRGFYSLGAEQGPELEVKPTPIPKDSLLKSSKNYEGGAVPVSFADCFATDAVGDKAVALYGLVTSRKSMDVKGGPAELKSKGFMTPGNESEYFYVNVGITEENVKKIKRVPDKEFTESITFSLVVNW
jgi:hypothetical protein